MNRGAASAAGTAAMIFASAASAQTAPPHHEHVRFSYEAPATCPNAVQFLEMVSQRDAELIADGDAVRSLSVTFDVQEKWRGTLRSEGIASGEATRTITGDSCDEVAHAMAIFTALALREDSPDEVAPARPKRAPADVGKEDQTSEFMPTTSAPVLERDLHGNRFALTAKESLSMMDDGGKSFGTGLVAAYYLNTWFGLDVQGDLLFNFKPSDDPYANDVRARIETHAEFLPLHAHGTLLGAEPGNPFDLFIKQGFGFIWTRPRDYADSEIPDDSYVPRLLFDLGTGMRLFLTESLALSLETDFLAYDQPLVSPPITDVGGPSPSPGSQFNNTYNAYGRFEDVIALGAAFQLGLTWFPSAARKRPQ